MSFTLSLIGSYLSGVKNEIDKRLQSPQAKRLLGQTAGVGSLVSVSLSTLLGYQTLKAGAYTGLNCFSDPWQYNTLIKIIYLPKPFQWLPDFVASSCARQVTVALGSAAATLSLGILAFKLGRVYLATSPKRQPPQKALPPSPVVQPLVKILDEMQTRPSFFDTVGLTRVSGNAAKISQVQDTLLQKRDLDCLKTIGPHDLVGLIKKLFADNQLPRLPAATITKEQFQKESDYLKKYLSGLSAVQHEVATLIMQKLLVPILNGKTRMDAQNLTIAFSRSLFEQSAPPVTGLKDLSPEQIKELFIDKNEWLFKELLAHYG